MNGARVVMLAPNGRDSAIAATLLRDGKVAAEIENCTDVATFSAALDERAAFAVATEEALRGSDLRELAALLAAQPAWSDLPFIILTGRGGGAERNPAAGRLSQLLGNVIFVERPFHPTTFVSAARTALRGRLRQFEARARIEALHEGEARLRTAMQAGRLGAWEFEVGSGVLTTSDTCKAVFGRTPETDFSYAALLDSIHPEDRPEMQARVRASIETGVDYAIEYRNIWPDGATHWAELRARVVRGRDGCVARLVGVSNDITERKTAEARLRQANESLEQRVQDRTEEVREAHSQTLSEMARREEAQEQLRQAQKIEAMGQITGGVAHDFNNLLLAVLANLDLLRRRVPPDSDAPALIEGAIQAAQRGAALTQRLLAFSRRQALTLRPVDGAGLVEGMMDLIHRSLTPGVELAVDLGRDLSPALGDHNQLELALLNLVVNARDAMPDGGIITIRLDQARPAAGDDLPPGDYLRLTVADTGTGMDEATLARAVEPFFSTKEPGKGTGLGLSMIDGLARQLDGRLRLRSARGEGTQAELWLPVAEAAAVAPSPEAAPPPVGAAAPLTILFVEDEVIIAMATRAMLTDLGHRVIDARSGPRALEIIEAGTAFDLMITDFSMPKMTGLELAARARTLRPALPILLATGYMTMPEDSTLELPLLSKPYMQRELREKIASVMASA